METFCSFLWWRWHSASPLPKPRDHALRRADVAVCATPTSVNLTQERGPRHEAAPHSCRLRAALREKGLHLWDFQTAQGSQGRTEHAPGRTGPRQGPRMQDGILGQGVPKTLLEPRAQHTQVLFLPLKASSRLPRGRRPAGRGRSSTARGRQPRHQAASVTNAAPAPGRGELGAHEPIMLHFIFSPVSHRGLIHRCDCWKVKRKFMQRRKHSAWCTGRKRQTTMGYFLLEVRCTKFVHK